MIFIIIFTWHCHHHIPLALSSSSYSRWHCEGDRDALLVRMWSLRFFPAEYSSHTLAPTIIIEMWWWRSSWWWWWWWWWWWRQMKTKRGSKDIKEWSACVWQWHTYCCHTVWHTAVEHWASCGTKAAPHCSGRHTQLEPWACSVECRNQLISCALHCTDLYP